MKTEKICRLMKLSFSTVILQLLYISLCLWAQKNNLSGDYLPVFFVPKMLEYCAASASLTVAGGFFLEYVNAFL